LQIADLESTSEPPYTVAFMIENIYFALELAVNPGRFEDLKTLMAELGRSEPE